MTSKTEISGQTPDANAPPPTLLQRGVAVVHWAVSFVGIGWVLNAIASVKVYNAVKGTFPEGYQAAELAAAEGMKVLGARLNFHSLTENDGEKATELGKDLVMIAGMGTGGFLMLPLQKFYSAHRHQVTRALEGIYCRLTGKPAPAAVPEAAEPEMLRPHKESLSHWVAGRVVGFAAGCSAYIGLKYVFPKTYDTVNEKFLAVFGKFIKEKNRPLYLADQIAVVGGIVTLASTKTLLDHLFPLPAEDTPARDTASPPALEYHRERLRREAPSASRGI